MEDNFNTPQELLPSHVVSGLVGQVEVYGSVKSGSGQSGPGQRGPAKRGLAKSGFLKSGPAPGGLFVTVNLWQQLTEQGNGVLFRILFEGEEAERIVNLGVKAGNRLRARLDGAYPKAYATGEGQDQKLVAYLESWGSSAVLLA
ncbi:MAG: hypothetical protein LBE49_06260 [Deltaproteobacteria bacterium]|jgi:hypothetical protein|nr:hypothetical protein [Deltaproteobacteria bacterium]